MKKIALMFLFVFAVACGGSKAAESEPTSEVAEQTTEAAPEAGPETAAENVLPNDGTRQVGDVTKCPVSGDIFQIAANSPTVEHNGGTYYFCCKGCVKDFTADPEKFLAGGVEPHHEEHGEEHHSAE